MKQLCLVFFSALILQAMSTSQASAAVAPWEIENLAGKPAAQFTLADVNGKNVSLAGFAGRVVLLNFWATWCAPCRHEMPELEKLQTSYGDQGFTVIGVGLDEDVALIRTFLKRLTLSFPILHDPDMNVATKYGVFAYPTSFLIDRHGVVHQYLIGEQEWNGSAFRAVIEKLLQEKK